MCIYSDNSFGFSQFAASMPEYVDRMVLLEGLTLLTVKPVSV